MTIREDCDLGTLKCANCCLKTKCQSEREVGQIEFGVSVIQDCVAQTKKIVEEGDWRRASIQASEEERRVGKIGKVELSLVRARYSNLQPLCL